MKHFAVWVQFDVKPGMLPAFLEAARLDAQGSVGNEPGCHRFDILQDPDVPNRVYFYEVYEDEAAFAAHREMPHFKTYFTTTDPMVAAKSALRMPVEACHK
jgi:(4S)-4-hydroxy-5-phosphonooxypentane-2,3-dione isomerase